MTYDESIAYLVGRINYEQQGMPASEVLRLDRVRRLLSLMGDPHLQLPVIHVTGTKGKGSTATMIAALIQGTGIRTGLHTSPHLERIEERMRVDGIDATPEEFVQLVEQIIPLVSRIDGDRRVDESELTFFEITTALTLAHFAAQDVECAVVEVGMGGRLDATNVVSPRVCVLTGISLDHTKTLGNTIAEIAREKAGIIKRGVPVVSSATHPDASSVIRSTAQSLGCPLFEWDRDFHVRILDSDWTGNDVSVELDGHPHLPEASFRVGLVGKHQAVNAGVAWLAASLFQKSHCSVRLNPAVLEHLSIPARIEVLSHRPMVILDAAHNTASAEALADTLSMAQTNKPRILIFAATKDKDWRSMLVELLPRFDDILVTQYQTNDRGVPIERIATFVRSNGKSPFEAETPSDAWQRAWKLLQTSDGTGLACVTGSFFLASEIRPSIVKSLALNKTM